MTPRVDRPAGKRARDRPSRPDPDPATVAFGGIDRDVLLDTLDDTERRLDPVDPERGGRVRVLGYGEISVALEVADLPGLVCKRMSGYADAASTSAYLDLVGTYIEELTAAGVEVVATEVIPVRRPGRPPVVYLVQPRLDPATLGHALLRSADDAALAGAIRRALDTVAAVAARTAERTDGVEVALDGQLSNWSFPDDSPTSAPILVDIGTPMLRRHGQHAMDLEVLLAPVPPGLRAHYRRRGLVEAYLDDYFVPRTVALDLLGNFHKEGAPERIEPATQVVNDWLAAEDLPGPREPITAAEVEAYYRDDADLLALYLRLRRMDRFLRAKAARRTYDYVLPGRVQR